MTLFPSAPSRPESIEPAREEPRLLTRHYEAPSEPSKPRPVSRRRAPRIVARTVLALLAVVLVVVFTAAIWLRHSMRAALPQIDGKLQVSGLSAPVTVTRDDHGVPSIQAANLDDLLFAQGFITAQDRLFQMDALRRHAAGELAEILGSGLIEHDRTQRILQIRAAADRALAQLGPDQLHQLQAYANGVNAFLAQNADHLPVEFHLLHYAPAQWTPRDTLLVQLAMVQDLSTEFPTKILRESFSAHLPPELLADLYPVGSWRDHPPSQAVPDLTSPRPEIEQIPLDPTQSQLANPEELLRVRSELSLQTCEGCRSGSNNWAVAGLRSASGRPLVSNDMHLALGVPDIWYEATLHASDGSLDVAGLTLPGAPFIVVGRNAHVAWGFTNLGGDVQDVYVEHFRGTGDTTEYQRADGSWAGVQHHTEHIRVRAHTDVTLDVLTTTHTIGASEMATPIISPLYPSEHRSLSLAWTAYDPATLSVPFLAVNAAADGATLAAAFEPFGGPTLNLIYADDRNHIGYHAIGRIPIRGPAEHHPVAPPAEVTAPPAEDEEGTSHLEPPRFHQPEVQLVGYARRQRVRPSPQQPVKEDPIPAAAAPLGYTIGSPIPAVPVDALDPNAQWTGYIPYAEMPAVTDPGTGVLATANARITPNDYPYAIALNWAPPYRVERITHVLAESTGPTPADMLRLQMDVHSELDLALAQRLAYALDHASLKYSSNVRLRQTADILRRWNGDVDVDAPAPAIVAAARAELWPMLLIPQITAHDKAAGLTQKNMTPEGVARLYTWAEQSTVLEGFLLHSPKRWLPPGYANWNDLLAAAVDRGLTTAGAPPDLTKWSYSKSRPVEISHPLLSNPLMRRMLGVATGSGPRVVSGDTSTVKATSRGFGPTERFTADLSNAAATTSNITTGQSGNPASPYYLDQLPHWLAGTTLPLPLHDAHVGHTLLLQP